MKKLAWLFLIMPFALVAQQQQFEITGKAGSYSSPYRISVTFVVKGKQQKLSSDVNNGVFTIKGSVDSIQSAYLSLENPANTRGLSVAKVFWLEPGIIQANTTDTFSKVVFSGTKLNDDNLELQKEIAVSNLVKDDNQRNALLKFATEKFIKTHPNSLLSLVQIDYTFSRGVPDISVVEPLFNSLTPAVKNSPMGKTYQRKLAGWKMVNIGSLAPDFTQPDQNGKQVKLTDFKGKYVLLDFWASWCHPCRDEHPNLIEQYHLYKNKNFTILSISLDGGGFGTKASWLNAIKDDRVGEWTQVCDLSGSKNNKVQKLYGVGSIPENFLIGPDGKIIGKSLRGENLNTTLKGLFAASADNSQMAAATASSATMIGSQPYRDSEVLPLDSAIRTGKLANGFTYYIRKNKEPESKVYFYLANKVGSILEKDNQRGLAHFMEHMNFNGTKHFPKNELVNYLQKAGVRFGADINAYTGFDETVYQLPLPSDKPDVVSKGIEIMHDWAQGALLDPIEIDKERGVILEEKRLGKGAGNRMQQKIWPVLFNNSRYTQRSPIGVDTVLKYFKPETIKSFYQDWYRPNLQALVVVGDIDVNQIEKRIKEVFSDLKNPVNEKQRIRYTIPLTGKNQFISVTDKELNRTTAQVYFKHEAPPFITAADYKSYLLRELFDKMLAGRFTRIGDSRNNPPFLSAGGSISPFLANLDQYAMSIVAKPGELEKSFKAVWEATEQLKRFGFTSTELERAKKALLEIREKAVTEKDKTYSAGMVTEYVQTFLKGIPAPGSYAELQLSRQYLPLITLEDLLKLANEYIQDINRDIVITAPEEEAALLPDEKKVNQWIAEVRAATILPYLDTYQEKPLLTQKPLAGKVIAQKLLPAINATEWTLSNGAKVIVKPTDFEADDISFEASANGGNSMFSDKDYPAVNNLPYIITTSGIGEYTFPEINEFVSGKNLNFGFGMDSYRASFSGFSSAKYLENLLQIMYLYFTNPRYDRKAFDGIITNLKASVKKEVTNPEEIFQDSVSAIMTNNNIRARRLTKEQIEQINLDQVFEAHKKQFGDASNFTFVFAGNIDTVKLKGWVEQYIASLPAAGRQLKALDIDMHPPAGKMTKTIYKGIENKSRVNLTFSAPYTFNALNNKVLDALKEIISIRIITRLREEESGVYSPDVLLITRKIPEERYSVRISFGCAPQNVEKLIASTLDELNKLKIEGPSETDLEKYKAENRSRRKLSLKSNNFWINYIQNQIANGQDLNEVNEYENILEKVNKESAKAAAATYLSGENMIQLILKPESNRPKNN